MGFELEKEFVTGSFVVTNYDTLKEALENAMKKYKTLVVTEDDIKASKETKATLNKLKKNINDERIAKKKEYLKVFETGENQCNMLCSIIDEAVQNIDAQLKAFTEKEQNEKKAKIVEIFKSVTFPFEVNLEQIWNDKWLLKGTSLDDIKEAINERSTRCSNDLIILNGILQAETTSIQLVYKTKFMKCLDKDSVMSEYIENKKAMDMAVLKKQLQEKENKQYTIAFQVKASKLQIANLEEFMKLNGISYEQIKK